MRDQGKPQGAEAEKHLSVDNLDWKKAASKLAESGIGIDYFIAAPGGAYVDVATIGRWL
jgi:protein transport protein SEC24